MRPCGIDVVVYEQTEYSVALLLDSVILLDAMSSDEDTVEDADVKAAELDAQERTDRLMSMAEYRDEIYEYLRKSEVLKSNLCSFLFFCY